MRFKKLIAIAAVGLGVLSVSGAAIAATHNKAATAPGTEQVASVDTDNVQEGDQTGPDNETGAAEESSSEAGNSEAAGESDGPGGHEDPAGNVDHQNDGEE
jgi:hypothetical protein